VDVVLLRALGERNRIRIIQLLNPAPRAVGEIADKLGLRQPQVTKHLQMLERAGLVRMHPLGQRRIYALRREPFAQLGRWLDTIAAPNTSEAVLEKYGNAIKAEAAAAQKSSDFAQGRVFKFGRELDAPAHEIWDHWTNGRLVRRWWSPEHFRVVRARIEAVAGGRIEIVMQEGDGARHPSRGRFMELHPRRHLRFELGPLDPDGAPLLSAVHDVTLAPRRRGTKLSLTIRIISARAAAVPAVAGMDLGWNQLLDKLEQTLSLRQRKASPARAPRSD
jgi:uncharacterized protein YndB with AHSA1/START domain/DNA-binding transcriptional ArsR family regulator